MLLQLYRGRFFYVFPSCLQRNFVFGSLGASQFMLRMSLPWECQSPCKNF